MNLIERYLKYVTEAAVTSDIAVVAAKKNYRQNVAKVNRHCDIYGGDERNKCKHVFKIRALRKYINDLSKAKGICKTKRCAHNLDTLIATNKKKIGTLQKQMTRYGG